MGLPNFKGRKSGLLDLKVNGSPEKIEKFKDFSRPLSDFPVFFKADLIFKDFSI